MRAVPADSFAGSLSAMEDRLTSPKRASPTTKWWSFTPPVTRVNPSMRVFAAVCGPACRNHRVSFVGGSAKRNYVGIGFRGFDGKPLFRLGFGGQSLVMLMHHCRGSCPLARRSNSRCRARRSETSKRSGANRLACGILPPGRRRRRMLYGSISLNNPTVCR